MSNIEERLKNVRTLEDIVYLLNILFTNLNNQNKIYYDMFLNPTPMYIDLERYDENGVLGTIPLPNRAMDRILILTGRGTPEGRIPARIGTVYLDEDTKGLYVKTDGEDTTTTGWSSIYSPDNFIANRDYLTPTGNGSRLTALNADSITNGVLKVSQGGTGTASITDGYLVQGHNQSPFTSFDPSDLSVLISEFIGMIMWCPMDDITGRWLICDGREVSRISYSALFNKIGTKYGEGDGSTTFNLPNLIDRYVKGGTVASKDLVEGSVKKHTHELSGSTELESSHVHGPGTLEVKKNTWSGNSRSFIDLQVTQEHVSGAFSIGETVEGKNAKPGGSNDRRVYFKLQGNWDTNTTTGSGEPHLHELSGSTSENEGSSTNEVDHLVMVPVIRY
jgi:microcystin-dependent protein